MIYSAVGLLALLVLLVENFDILLGRSAAFKKPVWKAYRRFLLAVLAYYGTDILWGVLATRKMAGLLFADTALYFIAMALGALLWTRYAVTYLDEKNVFGRVLTYGGRLYAALVTLVVIVNIFKPILYTVDADCAYQPLKMRDSLLAIQILLLIILSVYAALAIAEDRGGKTRPYRTLALFGLIMVLFLFVQMWFPLLPMYSIGYMLGTCLLRVLVIGDEKEAYLHKLEEAAKIAELKRSISSLLDNMPGLSFSKDAKTGVYLACNQAFAEYAHKKDPSGVVGLTDAQIFDPDTARHFVEDDRMALSMDTPYIFFEDVPDAAGAPRQFQTTKLKFIDTAGRLCTLGMCQDVTDTVRIQRENATTKEAYEKARSTGIIYTHIAQTLARGYKFLYYISLRTEEYIKYRSDEGGALIETQRGGSVFDACRQEVEQLVYAGDREALLKALERGALLEALNRDGVFVTTYRLMDGEQTTYVRMTASRMEDDEEHIIIGIANVDAETRETMAKNEALAEALAAAEEASKAKTTFLSCMSHEIRTPMNAIIGLNTLALHDPSLSEQTREYLEELRGSAMHLLALINDILDMSRIEAGHMVLQKQEFAFPAMLEQVNTLIMAQCRDKGLTYECRILSPLDEYYIGDDMKLKEVLLNILSNAIKFTEAPGSVTFSVERTAVFEGQSTLRFRVKDTGVGMDKGFLPKVFEAFAQEDDSRRNRYGSTGLGMAITKRIVEMMNGEISVESEKGVGSEFTVTVTLRNCERQDGHVSAIKLSDVRVLVVDDDQVAAEHARMVLDEVGVRADVCSSGADALRMMEVQSTKKEPYNLVLMDWSMPEMNGLQASAEIRKRYSGETTVVVLTAFNWDDIQEEASRAGVDGFLAKPLFAANVIEEFQRIARRNRINVKKRASLAGRRILLAEDIPINAEIVMDVLAMENAQPEHAENGKIAVEMFEKSAPGYYAAVLMDIRMPEMDGLEAAAAIRALDRPDARRVPIIALTANAFDEDVQRSLQAGMNAHLTKPVEPERLCRTLEELIYEAEEEKKE